MNWLIPPEKFLSKNLTKYELLFSCLDTEPLLNLSASTGRKPTSRPALLRALIYKNLRSLPGLIDLIQILKENISLAKTIGFNLHTIPNVERLSTFLKDTPNSVLQFIRINLVKQLIDLKQISGNFLANDSCPIFAKVKQNNLKTVAKERFVKTVKPKGDPDSCLGVFATFPSPGTKKIQFFWGYRNHVITDVLSELPVSELTKPANVHEASLFIPHCQQLQNDFNFPVKAFIADSALDSIAIINFIALDLKAKPIIARNPRRTKSYTLRLSDKGIPICIAGFEMISRGKFRDKNQNRIRHKFICPIKGSRKFAERHPSCPWSLPQFVSGNGCITYRRVDLDESIRQSINYGSQEFKTLYNKRTSAERIFSRLLSASMQNLCVKGLQAVSNHCTIAHITVLAVAVTAVKSGNPDKIRFVKSLMPHLK